MSRWLGTGRVEWLLVTFCAILLAPMLLAGRMYSNVDLEFHYTNMVQFGAALGEGYWQPRWAAQAREGLGEPVFVYYAPLVYYVGGVLMGAGFSAWMALKLVIAGGLAGAALAMRRLCRRWAGEPAAALAGLCVILSPFVLLLEFSTANVPWMAGLGWGILLFDRCLGWEPDDRRVLDIGLAILFALLTLTHILSAIIVAPGLAVLVLVLRRGILSWVRFVISMALGMALAGFYVWPAVTSTKLINAAGWTGDNPYRVNFTFLLLYRPEEGLWPAVNTYLPALLLSGLLLGFFFLWKGRERADGGWRPVAALCAAGLAAFVLSTELTLPLWNAVPQLQMVQFPWRFLYVSLIAFYAVLSYWLDRKCWWFLLPMGVSLLAGAAFLAKMYLSGAQIAYGPEFLDRRFGMPEYRLALPGNATGYLASGGWPAECRHTGVVCTELDRRSLYRRWRLETRQAVEMRLPLYAYPAWGVRRNGGEEPLRADPATSLVSVALTPGSQEIEVYWRGLPEEWTGWALSWGGVFIAGFSTWRRKRAQTPGRSSSKPPSR